MPDLDFAGLREQLEREVRQPEFALIRVRRARRTAWRAATGAAVALVVVLAGAVSVSAYVRHGPGPVAPIGTPTVQPSQPPSVSTPTPVPSESAPAPAPVDVSAMTAAPSGTLFALVQRCKSDCLAQATYVNVLLRGGNLGATWTAVRGVPTSSESWSLLAASDSTLWLVGDGQVAGSSDGGHTWQSWGVGSNSGRRAFAGLAGGTAWIAGNGVVAVATGGGRPVNTPAQPPGAGIIDGLAVLGPNRAAVLVGSGNNQDSWFLTTDRGAHWTAQADPCANTPYAGSMWNTMAGAPDGSLWAVCAGGGGMGQQRKQLVTSIDGGRTWSSRGDLESAGYATSVFPFSATVGWRTGGRADLYRTTDGSHWTKVAITGDAAGGGTSFFTALGPSSGVYVEVGIVYSTVDGGQTWQQHPLPSIQN
jgi:hypothetical protein